MASEVTTRGDLEVSHCQLVPLLVALVALVDNKHPISSVCSDSFVQQLTSHQRRDSPAGAEAAARRRLASRSSPIKLRKLRDLALATSCARELTTDLLSDLSVVC